MAAAVAAAAEAVTAAALLPYSFSHSIRPFPLRIIHYACRRTEYGKRDRAPAALRSAPFSLAAQDRALDAERMERRREKEGKGYEAGRRGETKGKKSRRQFKRRNASSLAFD